MPFLRMRDFLTLRVKDSENKRYRFECKDSGSETGHSLVVTVEATHAAIVNGNMRFYRPDRMQAGCHTWTTDFAKPVLARHDDEMDPLGRVMVAKYQDYSYQYYPRYPAVKNLVFYSSGKSKIGLFDSVDWVQENLSKLKDYKGLGAIELGLSITNPPAIDKVLRNEYLTVSVGFQTDAAICSVCHTDWAVDDKCEHRPGQVYDGKKMFLIAGSMKFEEVSFVNFPADPFAVVKTKTEAMRAVQDSIATRIFFLGIPAAEQFKVACTDELEGLEINYDSDISLVDGDPRREDSMKELIAEIKSVDLTKERAFEIKAQLEAMRPTEASDKRQVTRALNTLLSIIRNKDWNEKVETQEDVLKDYEELKSSKWEEMTSDELAAKIASLNERAKAVGLELDMSVFEKSGVQLEQQAEAQEAEPRHEQNDAQDGKAEKALVKCLNQLEEIFNSLDEKYIFFDALDALMRKVGSEDYLRWVKKQLSESEDHVALQNELDLLHDGMAKAEQEIVNLKKLRDSLVSANAILTNNQKKALATTLVLVASLRKDSLPSADEIRDEIERKARRQLVSLQDSLNDLLEEMPEAVRDALSRKADTEKQPVEVTGESAAKETLSDQAEGSTEAAKDGAVEAREVDDNAKVAEPEPDHDVLEQKDSEPDVTALLSWRERRQLEALRRYQGLN